MKKNLFLTLFCLFLSFYPSLSYSDEGVISPAHSGPERNFQEISEATVLVTTQFGHGTGTVVKYKRKTFVITANHVISSVFGESTVITIIKDDQAARARVLYADYESDFAALEIIETLEVEPYKLQVSKGRLEAGDRAGYCGYPNRRDISCFVGRISGFVGKYVNLHSYAFSGASGSLVFDNSGKAIGILSAIEVGDFLGMPTPLVSIVWIVPVSVEMLESI